MPPSRLFSASRLCGGTRPWGRETTVAVALTVPSWARGLTFPRPSGLWDAMFVTCELYEFCGRNLWRACGGEPVTDDGKPKRTKSWREIDKMRDRGGSSQRDSRERERFESSTGYTKYKTNLERLFSGGAPLPEHLRGAQDAAGAERDEERQKLYAI